MKQFATYLRVSTQRQGASGLGLESQRAMCKGFIEHNKGVLAQEFVDVESGTHRNRKGLLDAIAYCKKNECALVIAKLDRLARDVEFCFKVINTGIEIHFVDMPQINTLLLGVFAAVAQYERELTSDRTKKALAVKKTQGAKLGASNEKYKERFAMKSKEQKKIETQKRANTKRMNNWNSRDTQTFVKVIQRVFPDACCSQSSHDWQWSEINTRGNNKTLMLQLMKDYHDIDHDIFASWNFDDDKIKLQVKLAGLIRETRNNAQYINS